MTAQTVAYWIVVFFSAGSIGSVGFAAWLELKLAKTVHSVRTWRAVMKLGYMLVTGTILWAVLPHQTVQITPYYYIYLAGLTLGGVGAIGTVLATIKIYVKYQPDV